MDCLTSLPPEVLQRLLSKLDQTALIGVVPSVCKTLRQHALTVATSVSLELRQKRAANNFAAWVAKNGHAALASLKLAASANIHVRLPFSATAQQLRHLLIAGGRLHQSAVCFEAAAQLTTLEIAGVTADRQLLQRLALLTSLESLTLHNIDSGPLIGMQQVSLLGTYRAGTAAGRLVCSTIQLQQLHVLQSQLHMVETTWPAFCSISVGCHCVTDVMHPCSCAVIFSAMVM
jgi:hypothetical protein